MYPKVEGLKFGKRYLKVHGWEMLPKVPRLAKDTQRSKVGKRYLNVPGIQTLPKGPAFGGGGDIQTNRHTHTHRHINTMTVPGLGAGQAE